MYRARFRFVSEARAETVLECEDSDVEDEEDEKFEFAARFYRF